MSPDPKTDALLDCFLRLCTLPGASGRERAVADAVAVDLADMGLEVVEDGAAARTGGTCGNLRARMAPRGAPRLWVTLAAHLDAVPPGHATDPFVEDGTVRSRRGVLAADDRAGVAILLRALEELRGTPLERTGVEGLFTVSEEVDTAGARSLGRGDLLGDLALVLDTSGPAGAVNVASPDARRFEVRFVGRAAHAGVEPEKGVNALRMAARAVAALPCGRLDPDTTFSPTVLQCGDATNVVPETALLRGEARSFRDGEIDRLMEILKQECESACAEAGGSFEMVVERMFHPFRLAEDHRLVRDLRRAAATCDLEFQPRRSGGGSDANALNAMGIPAANLAVGYFQNHSDKERLELAHFEGAFRLVMTFLREIDAAP